ncbi:MAG: UDP-N-acetylmuramoyl-L-alanyl-D-glutamate--2,6-diaminopimelate ligase, partial [Methylococcaceae bacterium]|nr:UDP-N-acetylmuramoyl-L-alanyl-D-glutamate--2,6-diaminopimelate ligase [Methylococcaceae bacterium]
MTEPASKPRTASLRDLIAADGDLNQVPDVSVSGLAIDSRAVNSGDAFFAVSGFREHGLQYCDEAIRKGAGAIVYDPRGADPQKIEHLREAGTCPLVPVPALRFELGPIADRFYGHPSAQLDMIGITGTNGKTSCCHFLAQALSRFKPSGVVGTIGWGYPGNLKELKNTTPEPIQLQSILAQFRDQGAKLVVMEVSSHALVQKRTRAVRFLGAAYTNITRDHLDYHKTMQVYVNAKLKLLLSPGLEFVVVNMDDLHADQILAAVPSNVRIMGFSRSFKSDSPFVRLKLSALRHDDQGVEFQVHFEGRSVPVSAPLFCDFNVDNLLTVIGVMLELGISLPEAVDALRGIKPVPGRLERFSIEDGGPTVIVDYAHTPHALQSILEGLRMHCRGSLWLVFGCGGDRDRGKRPLMGRIAEMNADHVVLTDDNPRHEDGSRIIKEILNGCSNPQIPIERDRRRAIG